MSELDTIKQAIKNAKGDNPTNNQNQENPSNQEKRSQPNQQITEAAVTDVNQQLADDYSRSTAGNQDLLQQVLHNAVNQGVTIGEQVAAAQQAGVVAAQTASMTNFWRNYIENGNCNIADALTVGGLSEAIESNGINPVKKTLSHIYPSPHNHRSQLPHFQTNKLPRLRPSEWMSSQN